MTTAELEKRVQDGVTGRLAQSADPAAAAVAQARQALLAAAGDPQVWKDPPAAVAAVCQGTLAGLLLLDKDVGNAAVPLLREMLEAAQSCHIDPSEAMTAAMTGMARVAALVPEGVREVMRAGIDDAFMDAGAAFAAMVHQAAQK